MFLLLGLGLAPLTGNAVQSQTLPVILNLDLLPSASPAGRAAYAEHFLMGNVNRAFALGSNGAFGGMMGAKTIEAARERALNSCKRKGDSDCRIYAENLAVLPAGLPSVPPPVAPEALIAGNGYAFIPDERFFWYGPPTARGIVVWGHGYGVIAHLG